MAGDKTQLFQILSDRIRPSVQQPGSSVRASESVWAWHFEDVGLGSWQSQLGPGIPSDRRHLGPPCVLNLNELVMMKFYS